MIPPGSDYGVYEDGRQWAYGSLTNKGGMRGSERKKDTFAGRDTSTGLFCVRIKAVYCALSSGNALSIGSDGTGFYLVRNGC